MYILFLATDFQQHSQVVRYFQKLSFLMTLLTLDLSESIKILTRHPHPFGFEIDMNAGLYIDTNSFIYQKYATLPVARKICFVLFPKQCPMHTLVTCNLSLLTVPLAQERDRLLPEQFLSLVITSYSLGHRQQSCCPTDWPISDRLHHTLVTCHLASRWAC